METTARPVLAAAPTEPVWPVFAAFVASTGTIVATSRPLLSLASPGTGADAGVGLPILLALSLRVALVFLLASLAVTRPPRRVSLRLAAGRLTGQHVFVIMIGAAALGQAYDRASQLLGGEETPAWKAMQQSLGAAHGAALLAALIAIGPISAGCQDLFFRGAMQTRLMHRWGPAAAVAVTSVCFALAQRHPPQMVSALLLGLYAGSLTELSGSVWAGVAAHVMHNTLATGLAPLELPRSPALNAGAFAVAFAIAAVAFLWLRHALASRALGPSV